MLKKVLHLDVVCMYAQMLAAAQAIFSKSRQHRTVGSKTLVDQLLLILSDGRGVFADGSTVCKESNFASRRNYTVMFDQLFWPNF